ncbi:MAG: CoA-binding protein [Ginsengibacter sp.]
MANKKTLVLGASANPSRYSYLAVNSLRSKGHDVVALGKKTGLVGQIPVETEAREIPGLDTVTLYLNPANQKQYYNYILGLHPKRIIFNPGAENEAFSSMARQQGIETQEACTLVLLSTGQY